MKVLCNQLTKKILGFNRWDGFAVGQDEIQIDIDFIPDFETQRLNNTNDGIIDKSQAELDADAEQEKDKKAGNLDPILKALVLALNDGSLVPGSNYTNQQLKQIIKAKL